MTATLTPRGIRRDLYAILERHAPDGVVISGRTTIAGDLALDSLGVMEVIADIEKRFAVVVPDERLPELFAVEDVERELVAFLRGHGRLSS